MPAFGWLEAAIELAAGRLEEAEAGSLTIVRLAEDLQEYGYRVQAYSLLGRIAQLRGDLRQAGEYLNEASRWTRSEVRLASAQGALARAQLLDAEGDSAAGARLLGSAVDSPAALARHTDAGYAELPAVVRIALRGQDTDLAERAARLAQLYADRNPDVATAVGAASHARALLDDDAEVLGEAVAALRTSPRLLSRASAAEDYGRVLVAHQRREEGIAELDRVWTSMPPSAPSERLAGCSVASRRPARGGAAGWRPRAVHVPGGPHSPTPNGGSPSSWRKVEPTGRRRRRCSCPRTPWGPTCGRSSPSLASTPGSS